MLTALHSCARDAGRGIVAQVKRIFGDAAELERMVKGLKLSEHDRETARAIMRFHAATLGEQQAEGWQTKRARAFLKPLRERRPTHVQPDKLDVAFASEGLVSFHSRPLMASADGGGCRRPVGWRSGRADGGDGDEEDAARASRPSKMASSRDDSSQSGAEARRTSGERRTEEEAAGGSSSEGREVGSTWLAQRSAVVLRGRGATADRSKLRCRLAYRSLAARRSRAMARPLCVARLEAARGSPARAPTGWAPSEESQSWQPAAVALLQAAVLVTTDETTCRTTSRRTCRMRLPSTVPWPPGKDCGVGGTPPRRRGVHGTTPTGRG